MFLPLKALWSDGWLNEAWRSLVLFTSLFLRCVAQTRFQNNILKIERTQCPIGVSNIQLYVCQLAMKFQMLWSENFLKWHFEDGNEALVGKVGTDTNKFVTIFQFDMFDGPAYSIRFTCNVTRLPRDFSAGSLKFDFPFDGISPVMFDCECAAVNWKIIATTKIICKCKHLHFAFSLSSNCGFAKRSSHSLYSKTALLWYLTTCIEAFSEYLKYVCACQR